MKPYDVIEHLGHCPECGATKQEQGEPYGYLKLNTGRFVNEVEGLNPMKDKSYLPLYTTPQQRKPLTDEQIDEIYFKSDLEIERQYRQLYGFVRAIEAAHGITK